MQTLFEKTVFLSKSYFFGMLTLLYIIIAAREVFSRGLFTTVHNIRYGYEPNKMSFELLTIFAHIKMQVSDKQTGHRINFMCNTNEHKIDKTI